MKKNYFEPLVALFARIEVSSNKGKTIAVESALAAVVRHLAACPKQSGKVFVIGNGGSAGIAGHIAVDLLKNARIPALTLNDASFLTCIGNDLGFESVFRTPIEMLAGRHDILLAISSSGKSANILNAVAAARSRGCFIVTFSGFRPDNPLRRKGEINFYVPSLAYGSVEIMHMALCHAVVDELMRK